MSTNKPLITYAITTYNQASSIRKAIECAFAQDYENLEIIVSDDQSSDGTYEIAQDIVSAYDGPHKVRLNRNKRNLYIGGHISLINRMASGELVVNAAGDDVSVPWRTSVIVSKWLSLGKQPGIIHSACYRVSAERRTLFQNPRRDNLHDIEKAIFSSNYIIGATSAWDRALFASYGDLRSDLTHEDHAMLFRTLLAGRTVAYIEEPLVDHIEGGLTTFSERPAKSERLKILSRFLVDAEQKLLDLQTSPDRELEHRLQRIADYYSAAMRFEDGWPDISDTARWLRRIGPVKTARLFVKRGLNRLRDRAPVSPSSG